MAASIEVSTSSWLDPYPWNRRNNTEEPASPCCAEMPNVVCVSRSHRYLSASRTAAAISAWLASIVSAACRHVLPHPACPSAAISAAALRSHFDCASSSLSRSVMGFPLRVWHSHRRYPPLIAQHGFQFVQRAILGDSIVRADDANGSSQHTVHQP